MALNDLNDLFASNSAEPIPSVFDIQHAIQPQSNSILDRLADDGNVLSTIPDADITEEMCKVAITRKGGALKFVPDRFKTKELCLKALNTNGYAIQYFKPEYIDHDTCVKAAGKDAGSIKFIPSQFLDKDVWVACIMRDGRFIKEIPAEYLTDDIVSRFKERYRADVKIQDALQMRLNGASVTMKGNNVSMSAEQWHELCMRQPNSIYQIPDEFITKDFLMKFYVANKQNEYGKYVYDRFNKKSVGENQQQSVQQIQPTQQPQMQASIIQSISIIKTELSKIEKILGGL